MKKLTLVFAILFSFTLSSLSQEWVSIDTPVSENLIIYDISFPTGQNDVGFAVGSNVTYNGQGTVLKTVDGGLTWEVVWESADSGTGMESVYFLNTMIGYVGTMGGDIMKTTNGGTDWTSFDFDDDADQGSVLDIEFFDNSNGVLCTQWGGVYISSNSGSTWNPGAGIVNLQDLCYADATTLFGAQNGETIRKSTDGGMTWSTSYTGSNMFAATLGVHFSDIDNGLVTSEEGTVFVTHNSGDSWEEQSVPGQFGLMRGAWVFDADLMYATGTPGQVYVTEDGGDNWVTDSEIDFDPSYYKIKFTENGTGFVVGSGGNGGTILRKDPPGGCTDPEACNYDSAVETDDGSCIYPDGCTDPAACNYDSTALCDDESCVLPDGCTDSEACNYDSTALCDDGSCIYADGIYDCDGNCWNDADGDEICDELEVDGCIDTTACNYNSLATDDDGSCLYPDGCTDTTACNFISLAQCDDGSCIYPEGCSDSIACNYDSSVICPDNNSCIYPDGCTDSNACNYDSTALCDDESCEYPDGCTDSTACNYDSLATCDDGTCFFAEPYYDCDGECLNDLDGDGICDEEEVEGCTDSAACNYDSLATDDDGSCTYVEAYDIMGNISPGAGTQETYTYQETTGSSYEWVVTGGTIISGQGTSSITVEWDDSGTGSIILVETNADGCIGPEAELAIDITTSISEFEELNLRAYPNPASQSLTLEWDQREPAMLTVYDASGKIAHVTSLVSKSQIDVSNFESGIYLFKLDHSGQRAVVRVSVMSGH